jgi:hypothetical protein
MRNNPPQGRIKSTSAGTARANAQSRGRAELWVISAGEVNMRRRTREAFVRKFMLCAIAAVAIASTTQVNAMGGGGGGGGGGGDYGGSLGRGPSLSSDDYTVAMRLIKHKQYAEAIPHLQMVLADKPHDADILNYLGFTKRMVGDYDASLDYYTRALAVDPNHKGVHEYLGELYLQKNDLRSAQKELATLATLCPSGCDERDALTKAIGDYKPAAPTPAAATTTGPSVSAK